MTISDVRDDHIVAYDLGYGLVFSDLLDDCKGILLSPISQEEKALLKMLYPSINFEVEYESLPNN